jgi:phosphopantothenoylcysteine decarboxylase/phosphopantothenate--cysteine ligase
MGYAMAEAARRRGAKVILVSGPTALEPPAGVERVAVRTTEQMRRAVLDHAAESTVVIKAAAVADYRPAAPQEKKMKRGKGRVTLELEPTPDILADLSAVKGRRILVGFAAETERVAENARAKLAGKKLDLVVANDVTQEGAGFDADTNVVTLYTRDGHEEALPKMNKLDVAHRILDEVVRLKSGSPSS